MVEQESKYMCAAFAYYRLKIENSVPQDSGNYMCIATNRAGEKNATAYLKIKKGR